MSKLKSIYKNVGLGTFAMIVSGISALLINLLIVNELGLSNYGVVAIIIAWVTLVFELFDFRVWETLTRYLSKYIQEQSNDKASALILLCLLIEMTTGILIFLAVFVFSNYLSSFDAFVDIEQLDVILFSLSLVILSVNNSLSAILRVLGKFKNVMIYEILLALSKLILIVYFGLIIDVDLTISLIFTFYVISSLIGTVYLFVLTTKSLENVFDIKYAWLFYKLREDLQDIKWLLINTNLSSLWGAIIKNIDIVFLSSFVGTNQVGLFKIVKVYVQQFARIVDPIYMVLFPTITSMGSSIDKHFLKKITIKLSFLAMLIYVASISLYDILTTSFIKADVVDGWLLVPIMMVGIVIAITFVWLRAIIISMDQSNLLNLVSMVGCICYVVFSFFLIPVYGIYASAFAFSLNYILTHALLLFLMRK